MSELYRTRGSEALQKRAALHQPLEKSLPKNPSRQKKRKPRLNYERYAESAYAPTMNVFNFVMLIFMAGVFIYSCTMYLRVSDKIATVNTETYHVRNKMEKIKAENDNKENKIYAGIDLEEIREKALNELGMVYPYKNHVIKYQAVTGGYVRQFGDLEGEKSLSFFEKVLSMFAIR